jgi:hypothetical protein
MRREGSWPSLTQHYDDGIRSKASAVTHRHRLPPVPAAAAVVAEIAANSRPLIPDHRKTTTTITTITAAAGMLLKNHVQLMCSVTVTGERC